MGAEVQKAPSILLIEDSEGDVELIKQLLGNVIAEKDIHVASSGEDALHFLHKSAQFAGSPDVDIIIMDLNLPRKSGYEVLAEIKQDERLRRTPVIVLTGSVADKDIDKAYELGANCYVVKPVMFKELAKAVELIDQFWLRTAALPHRPSKNKENPYTSHGKE